MFSISRCSASSTAAPWRAQSITNGSPSSPNFVTPSSNNLSSAPPPQGRNRDNDKEVQFKTLRYQTASPIPRAVSSAAPQQAQSSTNGSPSLSTPATSSSSNVSSVPPPQGRNRANNKEVRFKTLSYLGRSLTLTRKMFSFDKKSADISAESQQAQSSTNGRPLLSNSTTSSFNTVSSAPPQQGRNRANDKQYQELKAAYLSNFDFRGVQCTATPLLPSVLRGVTTEIPVLFQIKVGQRSQQSESEFSRTPFNASLVLDISGSMSGSRLGSCKKAIFTIIGSLTQHDTLSLVTYGSETKTIFVDCNHTHKEMMIQSVTDIKSEGRTNLNAGLELGIQTLRQSMKKETAEILKRNAHRVFLFSDGLVNEGITSPQTIEANVKEWIKNDISISIFGIGDDYDEKLMKVIADVANGDSSFIETENDIEDFVAKGLRGISRMIAPAAVLKVRGLGDAVIKDIPGYEQTIPGEIVTKSLRTNGLIQLVVNLDIRVPGLEDFSENDMEDVVDSRKILGWSLTLEEEHFVNLDDCEGMTGTVSVNYTADSAMLTDDKKDPDVVSYLTIKEAAKLDQEVMEHLANNRTQEAVKAKEQVVSKYSSISSSDRWGFSPVLHSQSERLVRSMTSCGSTSYTQRMSQQQQQEAAGYDMGFDLFD